MFGQADEVYAFAGFDLAVGVGEDVELAAAGAHFLQVALEFVEQRISRGDGDHGHGFGHQRQRAVLEFARGVGLGVDVGDLLELERAFEGDGVVHAAPEKQGVFAAGELFGPGDDLRLQRQHALHGGGQVAQGGEHGGFSLVAQAAFGAGQRPGQQVERDKLGGEGLGRGYADFGPGTGEELHGGFACHGAGGDVDHGQGVGVAELLGVFERGQGVGGFARLGNDDDQRARVGYRVAVAVFAGDLHLDGHAGDGLDPVLGGEPGVEAGAAGQNAHAADGGEHALGLRAEQCGGDGLDAVERVGDGARLLENFFLHEVAVRAKLHGGGVGGDGAYFAFDGLVGAVDDPHLAQLQVGHIAVFEEDELVGGAGQRQRVGGEEVFVLTQANDQRRTVARADDAVRLLAAEYRNRIRAVQLLGSGLHRLEQIAGVEVIDQVGDDFGVGLALELVAV